MNDTDLVRERRKQNRLAALGSNSPRCGTCGETDWRTLELHHVAGQKYDDTLVAICRNCHRKLSDEQCDHPAFVGDTDMMLASVGHFLLGLADMLRIIIEKLVQFGAALIVRASQDDGQLS